MDSYLFFYFTDSVLRAPVIGCMLMCLIASLVGVFVVLKGKALIGEVLSHAAYPGVIIALLIERLLFFESDHELRLLFYVLLGAFFSCILGVYSIAFLEKHYQVAADAALSFVLSSFFGVGILVLSLLQQDYPMLYKELQSYLFGQAATLRDVHIAIYAPFAVVIIAVFVLFFKEFQAVVFDPTFADVVGIKRKLIEQVLFFLLVFAVVLGIRSCGVVLLSAMLVFPAVTARRLTNSLSLLLVFAGLIGALSGFFGVVASHELSLYFWQGSQKVSSMPTGPVIVLVAALFFLLSLLCGPSRERGIARNWRFFWQCQKENLLKMMWQQGGQKEITKAKLKEYWHKNPILLYVLLYLVRKEGWVKERIATYQFTAAGAYQAKKIIQFHKLWELYLIKKCHMAKSRAHLLAEEMEHLFTPEIESELLFEHERGHL